MAQSGTTAAIKGSKIPKLMPLFSKRAINPSPAIKARPQAIEGANCVTPFVRGMSDRPMTWKTTEAASIMMIVGVRVIMLTPVLFDSWGDAVSLE